MVVYKEARILESASKSEAFRKDLSKPVRTAKRQDAGLNELLEEAKKGRNTASLTKDKIPRPIERILPPNPGDGDSDGREKIS